MKYSFIYKAKYRKNSNRQVSGFIASKINFLKKSTSSNEKKKNRLNCPSNWEIQIQGFSPDI